MARPPAVAMHRQAADTETHRSLYTVTFLLNTILISHLERFIGLPSQIQSLQLNEFPIDAPAGASTGYQAGNQEGDPEATGSYSRSTGREREGVGQ